MKLLDQDGEFEQKCNQKMMKIFSHDEMTSMATTLLGACDLIASHVTKEAKLSAFNKLPKSAQYGVLQFVQWYKIFGSIVRDEIKERKDLNIGYFPCNDQSWKNDEDFEKRINLLVTTLYKQLNPEQEESTTPT